jgi:hypothetical protein
LRVSLPPLTRPIRSGRAERLSLRAERRLPAGIVDSAAVIALSAFCALLLRRTLAGDGAMLGYDLYTYFFPAKTYASAALLRGELPLWNPYLFFGAPFLANVQMAVLYPPDLLFAALSFPRAVAVSQWLHLSLAAGGMYALCRRGWGLDPLAAGGGALAFAGAGFFGAHMGHLNQVHASAWLPLVALCVLRLAATWGRPGPPGTAGAPETGPARLLGGVPWLAAGGTAVALQLTAGHTQEAYYSLLAVGLLAAGYTVFPPARAPVRWTHLTAYGAAVLNGALLAGAQLLPAIELTRHSYRQGGIPLEEATAFGVERTNVLESLLPTFWSLPSQEVTGYVGVAVLPLVVVAFALSPARRTVLGLGALTLLAVTLAMGAYTPLYRVLYELVPLFDSFRAPGRWLLISSFALAGLAAHGAGALRREAASEVRETLALRYGLALTAAAAALLFFLWRSNEVRAIQWLPHARVAVLWAAAALAAVSLGLVSLFARGGWPRLLLLAGLAFELGGAAREMEYNQPGDAALYLHKPAVAAYLEAAAGPVGAAATASGGADRVLSIAVEERLDPARLRLAVPQGDGEYRRYASMREALKPSLGLAYALPSIDGYDGGLLPTREYARFKSLLVRDEPPVPHFTLPPQVNGKVDRDLLAALNVRYVLTDGRNGPPGPGWTLRESAPGAAWLYESEAVLPRAYLVAEVSPAPPDEDAAARRLAGMDLAREALVHVPEGALPAVSSGAAGAAPDGAGAAGSPTRPARIVRYSAGELEIETEAPGASLLVVTDSYYPGWRASVDGRPAPLLRTNLLFRGVPVPAGNHRVRLWFDPLSVRLGFALSAVALLANLGGLALYARRRRRVGAGEAPADRTGAR